MFRVVDILYSNLIDQNSDKLMYPAEVQSTSFPYNLWPIRYNYEHYFEISFINYSYIKGHCRTQLNSERLNYRMSLIGVITLILRNLQPYLKQVT